MFKPVTRITEVDRTCIINAIVNLHEQHPMSVEYTKRFMDLKNSPTEVIEEFCQHEPNYQDATELAIRNEAAQIRARLRKAVIKEMA
jgi:hypothetical protein